MLQVIVSTYAKFHAVQLASELEKRNLLSHFFTAYPKNIPGINKKIIGRFTPFLFTTAHYFPRINGFRLHYYTCRLFDRWVSKKIQDYWSKEGVKIFHGWSGFSLESIRKAKASGFITYIERSNVHILDQIEIIKEEAELLGLSSKDIPDSPYNELTDIMLQEYEEANYISVLSESSKKSFINRGFNSDRIIVTPLGCNFPPREISRNISGVFRLLCVGTDTYRKGIYYLIKAWQELNLVNAELTVVAPVTQHIINTIKTDNIKIRYPLDKNSLSKEYMESLAFCLPSIEDGFGMVVLEALAFGLPVIITDHVGASDIITEGREGFVVSVRDTEGLKKQIMKLYDNRDLIESMGANALALARQFTWDRYADKLVRHYKWASSSNNNI